jgi:hypothetical protein
MVACSSPRQPHEPASQARGCGQRGYRFGFLTSLQSFPAKNPMDDEKLLSFPLPMFVLFLPLRRSGGALLANQSGGSSR